MYTLYGTDESGSCMIEIALQRCAVPWHRVDASSWQDGEGSDALARINPLKQIPTLVTPNGQVLTESAAILIHLGLEYPKAELLAGDRAQILRGLLYIAANCYSASSTTRNAGWVMPMRRSKRNWSAAHGATCTRPGSCLPTSLPTSCLPRAMCRMHWASWRRRCRAGMTRVRCLATWRRALHRAWSG